MKKKYLIEFKNDLWVVVMDIIAVNAAYILSLLLRYYVHSEFKSAAMRFVNVYLKFAPFYTIICIIVFALFHLYNGVWRFASLNDMNRIISATAVTAIINFVCTTVFLQRLPISYYVVGTTLQFIFITLIRFSYRFLVFKGNGIRESINPGIPVIVIGGTIPSNKMIAYFESNTSFKPVAIVDYKLRGKSLNGLPVMESLEEALETFKVKNIIVMDPMMSDREKDRLRKISQQRNSELHDYTSVMMKGFANISLLDAAKIVKEPYKVRLGEELYDNLDEAMENLEGKYTIKTITGKDIVIEINQVS